MNNRLRPRAFVTGLTALLVSGITGCGSSSSGLLGQEAGDPANVEKLSEDPTVDLPGRVSVFLRVTAENGTPIAGLTGEDFNIYENGELVSQSESFQQIRAQPQLYRSYLHLLLDRSNSVQSAGEIDLINGAKNFVNLVLAEDDASFIKISWFDSSSEIFPIPGHDLGFTNDSEALNDALDDLFLEPAFDTSTNLYGAVVEAIDDLDEIDTLSAAQGVQNRSLSLVTFTDGTHQTGNNVTLGQALSAIQGESASGTGYSAFTIGVGAEIDPPVLAALGPNGSVARSEFGSLEDAFTDIGAQVRAQANSFYFLTYCSPKKSGINELRISVSAFPSAGDARFMFDADGFGAGCAFLDVRSAPEVADGSPRTFISDAVEAADGGVYAVGWRTSGCLEPGCGTEATAFIAKFRASPAPSGDTDEAARNDGRLDTSFGTDGYLDLQDPFFEVSGATSIVRSSSVPGGFAVGGWARASSASGFSRAVLWEVAPGGTTAVRSDLPALGGMGEADQAITDLVGLPGGGYAAGGFYGTSARTFAVWGLFPNFDIDTSFGSGGVFLGPGSASISNRGVGQLALGGGGRIYAAGEIGTSIRVVALGATDGQPVAGFGSAGVVDLVGEVAGFAYPAELGALTVDGSGQLIVGGAIAGAPPQIGTSSKQPALWRLLATGALDPAFVGSQLSPTYGTGLVTLRTASTSQFDADFGRDTMIRSLAVGPDGTIVAAGGRLNSQSHTDLVIFGFNENGISTADYNLVGFAIHDGSLSSRSFEAASVIKVLSSGAIWGLGVGYASMPTSTMDDTPVRSGSDVPVIWVDRDPTRVFAPIGD